MMPVLSEVSELGPGREVSDLTLQGDSRGLYHRLAYKIPPARSRTLEIPS